jgi:DNA-binding PadR family transcriptional regulator
MERRLLLLGLLRQEDMHGYRLNEFIERDLAFCTDIKKPSAYYLLEKMAEEGYLDTLEEQDEIIGRPPRTVYHLTPEGETCFQEMLRSLLGGYQRRVFPVDMAIAFVNELPSEEALQLLHKRRNLVEQELDKLASIPGHEGALWLVIEHHRISLEAEVAWLDRVITWAEGQRS